MYYEKQSYARPANEEGFAYGISGYSATKKYHEVKVEAVGEDSSTTPPSEIRTMQRGSAYVESTPENFTYDNNGNLTSDGRWTYTWNAENRLVSLETSAGAANAGVKREKYEYTYDWIGNKVESKHYEYADNAWVLESTNKRYYDDYNLIYETTDYADGRASEVRKYYYGLDLLGGLYGTAGTGGLRMMEIDGALCYVFNNQIGSLENLYSAAGGAQNSSSQVLGSLLAEYTYSAYGDVLMKSGELADKNHVTYSTRYSEGNPGLIYYTYRHYAPRLHKWINKDPIAERGGINLYQMVGNDTVGNWDLLGYLNAPIQTSKYYYDGVGVTFDRLHKIDICSIEIFVGHGSDAPFSRNEGTYNKALVDRNRQAAAMGLNPCQYASGAVGCSDKAVDVINERASVTGKNYGYDNPNRIDDERNNNILSSTRLDIALDKEIEAAKAHADSKMLKKEPPKQPACCEKVTIKVIIIVGDRGGDLANYWDALQYFYRKYGSEYEKPIIYPL